jgi:crotonobetainyl-CoA:carnitine CoA-transferase CaiB-like acyl-CoA transferase
MGGGTPLRIGDAHPHAAELVPEVRAGLAARTALEWEEMFGERVPCAAVRPIEDMFNHPQVLVEI